MSIQTGLISGTPFPTVGSVTAADFPYPGFFWVGTVLYYWNGTTAVLANVTSTQAIPAQSGQQGRVLGTDGTAISWVKKIDPVYTVPTILQYCRDTFTDVGQVNLTSHIAEQGSWATISGPELQLSGGTVFSNSGTASLCKHNTLVNGKKKWVQGQISNTTGNNATVGIAMVGLITGASTSLANANGYFCGWVGQDITIWKMVNGVTTVLKSANIGGFFSGIWRFAIQLDYSLFPASVRVNIVFGGTVNSGLSVTDSTAPIGKCTFTAMYAQLATGIAGSNVGVVDISASNALGNIFAYGDSIFTTSFNTQGVMEMLYDRYQGLCNVTYAANSGRSMGTTYAGPNTRMLDLTDDVNAKAGLFAFNYAIVEGGTNDIKNAGTPAQQAVFGPNTYALAQQMAVKLKTLTTNTNTSESNNWDQVWFMSVLPTDNTAGTDNSLGDGYNAAAIIYNNLVAGSTDSNIAGLIETRQLPEFAIANSDNYVTEGNNTFLHPNTLPSQQLQADTIYQTLRIAIAVNQVTDDPYIPSVWQGLKQLAPSKNSIKRLVDVLATTIQIPTLTLSTLAIATNDTLQVVLGKLLGQVNRLVINNGYTNNNANLFSISTNIWYAVSRNTGFTFTTITANTNTNSGIRFYTFVADRTGTVDGLALEVATLLATTTIRMSVYRSGADGQPFGAPIWQSAALDGGTIGIKGNATGIGTLIGGAAFTVTQGEVLWIGYAASATATLALRAVVPDNINFGVVAANGTTLPITSGTVGQYISHETRQIIWSYVPTGNMPTLVANTSYAAASTTTAPGPATNPCSVLKPYFLVRYSA